MVKSVYKMTVCFAQRFFSEVIRDSIPTYLGSQQLSIKPYGGANAPHDAL